MQHIILERNKLIHKNAELAQNIGAGNFDVETTHIDESDRLGNSLLKMLNSLLDTSEKETTQNWIAKGKEIISSVLNQQNNIEDLAYQTLVELIKYTDTIQGAFYIFDEDNQLLRNIATYAYQRKKYINQELLDLGVKEGDEISFTPGSEYPFTVDEEKLYRMFTDNITISNGHKTN